MKDFVFGPDEHSGHGKTEKVDVSVVLLLAIGEISEIATHVPHFHAYYGEHVAVFSISPVALIIGFIPQRQQRLVEAWAELHE